jgi:hypothetical protein
MPSFGREIGEAAEVEVGVGAAVGARAVVGQVERGVAGGVEDDVVGVVATAPERCAEGGERQQASGRETRHCGPSSGRRGGAHAPPARAAKPYYCDVV